MACKDWEFYINALQHFQVQDAVLCGFQGQMGGVAFAAVVVLGIINLPIYIRQGSVVGPVVLTLVIGGVILAETAAMVQGLVLFAVLVVLGLGPVLVLRRIDLV